MRVTSVWIGGMWGVLKQFGCNRWDAGRVEDSFLHHMNYWWEDEMKNISRTWDAQTLWVKVFCCCCCCSYSCVCARGVWITFSWLFNRWQTPELKYRSLKLMYFSLATKNPPFNRVDWGCWTCSHFNIKIWAFHCFFFVFHEKKRHLHFVWDMGSWAMCCPKSHGSHWGPEQKAELGHSLHLLPLRERGRGTEEERERESYLQIQTE